MVKAGPLDSKDVTQEQMTAQGAVSDLVVTAVAGGA